LDQVAGEWRERAGELADWAMRRLVNRTDVWGRYVQRKGEDFSQAITVPFREQRGKTFLDLDSLRKHFQKRLPSGQLGVHSASTSLTSRWLAIDIDRHDPDDEWAVTAEGNLSAARGWMKALADLGFDPLLLDSNGIGGFHLLVLFAEPMCTRSVHEFGTRLVADFAQRGMDTKPEVFPGKPKWDHRGNWLRLPGRHHTRPHFTRVWNDEPFAESQWLAGHDAIDRMLATRTASPEALGKVGIVHLRQTVCLDFDGVLHSYSSGWCGAEVIPDPPIHGTRQAVERLRQLYRVVVLSSRCRTEAGRQAVASWLQRHEIEVDEVCAHKPPALVYVDDRAIRFRGDWDDLLSQVSDFRK
jgi:hypothetical protein